MNIGTSILGLIIFSVIPTVCNAEYRVYQYLIKNKVTIQDAPNSHLTISSLNPITYMAYHGGSNLVSVDLLRTWICPGYTGSQKNYCSSPYGKVPAGVLE